mmetsp:Transcript_80906/g.142722  ORF Transcript_80906/g.142722 Transcript_80906/m.142722 type:complete len:176 (+) Transcript_80906:59-586(+)
MASLEQIRLEIGKLESDFDLQNDTGFPRRKLSASTAAPNEAFNPSDSEDEENRAPRRSQRWKPRELEESLSDLAALQQDDESCDESDEECAAAPQRSPGFTPVHSQWQDELMAGHKNAQGMLADRRMPFQADLVLSTTRPPCSKPMFVIPEVPDPEASRYNRMRSIQAVTCNFLK